MSSLQPQHTWQRALGEGLRRRLPPQQVAVALESQARKENLSGFKLASLVLQSGARPGHAVDPLVPAYLAHLLQLLVINPADILNALLQLSPYTPDQQAKGNERQQRPLSAIAIESVLNTLSTQYSSIERPKFAKESTLFLISLQEWFSACNTFETMMQLNSDALQPPDPSLVTTSEALGLLAAIFLSNIRVKQHLTKTLSEARRTSFANALRNFAATLSQWSQSQISQKLEMLSRTAPLGNSDTDGSGLFTFTDVSNAVSDVVVNPTRTGLYIYLNAALCSKPLVEDSAILNYLHARYPSDPQAMIIGIIVASFDAIANALHRHEPEHNILCYRSFICNKLPLLVLSLSQNLYTPLTSEHCIQMALARIEVHPFPPLSTDSNGINEILAEVRGQLIQACFLHQLMSESAASTALSQHGATKLQRSTRMTKDSLLAQCTMNVHKIDELASDITKLQGNAGAISMAVVETINHYCTTKETMALKTVCNALSRHIPSIDILLQYTQVETLLVPLSSILNDWTQDEDQSELTPAYEEFASILLLVLVLVHRYDLKLDDIDGLSKDSFIVRLLYKQSDTASLNHLSDDQKKQLGKWIKGLYATDDKGDSSGISDETMTGCPPQAFYLLAPVLFDQSVQAFKAGALDTKTLQGGLELFLEPFLLPAVVSGLRWLLKLSWKDSKDVAILLLIFDKLLRPSSISGDAQSMHEAIVVILAEELHESLTHLNRRYPNRKEITKLMDVVKSQLNKQRSLQSPVTEVAEWSSTYGGLDRAVSSLVTQLTSWGNQSELNPIPTKYTHRTIIAAIECIGVDKTLAAIVDEVTLQTSHGLGGHALEVGTALICAPSDTDSSLLLDQSRSRVSLRRALKLCIEDTKGLLKGDAAKVETIIRLDRLVDAQSVITQIQVPMTSLTNIGTDELMQGIDMSGTNTSMDPTANLDGTSTADFAAVMDSTMDMSNTSADMNVMGDSTAMNLDLSNDLFGGDQGMNFNLDTTSTGQDQDQNGQLQNQGVNSAAQNEDDIFAGLDFGGGMGDFDF